MDFNNPNSANKVECLAIAYTGVDWGGPSAEARRKVRFALATIQQLLSFRTVYFQYGIERMRPDSVWTRRCHAVITRACVSALFLPKTVHVRGRSDQHFLDVWRSLPTSECYACAEGSLYFTYFAILLHVHLANKPCTLRIPNY